MNSERRKTFRHKMVGQDIYALDHCSGKVAKISDLSAGGMQLSYPPDESTCNQWNLVDIFYGEPTQVLFPGLICKMVYDVVGLMENGNFSGMDVRLCGVRFDGLTDAQKKRLNKILENVATA